MAKQKIENRKSQVEEPKTERQKLDEFFNGLEYILHPKLFNAFKRQLYACYDENKQEAYARDTITPEALEIERMIKRLKENIEGVKHVEDFQRLKMFFIKGFYKELIKMFDIQ